MRWQNPRTNWLLLKGITVLLSRYITSTRGCTSDGVYVPCIYTHARWELLWVTQIFVVVFEWHVLSAYWFCIDFVLLSNQEEKRGEGTVENWTVPSMVYTIITRSCRDSVSACIFSFCLTMACSAMSLISERRGGGGGGGYWFHGVHHHHPQLLWLSQCYIFSFCLTMACSATSLVSERHGWERRRGYWLTADFVLLFTNQSVRMTLELKNQKQWWLLMFKTKIKIHKWLILTLLFVTR